MTKILLAVEESVLNQLDITTCPYEKCLMLSQKCDDCISEYFSKAKQDAQELIKQAKLELIDKIVLMQENAGNGFDIVRVDDILLIKSEIEKE